MKDFDKRFGEDFLGQLPQDSGVYIFRDEKREVIYIGKAKNLRRRISQYRLAKKRRCKMRIIVKAALYLEFQICADEDEALLLENKLIQAHRPRLNIAGAFSFMYPYLAWGRTADGLLCLAYSTDPNQLIARGWEAFGAFRSRDTVKAAYEALVFLANYLGHEDYRGRKAYGDIPFTRLTVLRQWPTDIDLRAFFRGESADILQIMLLALLEKPDARNKSRDVQEQFAFLRLFYRTEALNLREKLRAERNEASMIPQVDRDPLFLRSKQKRPSANAEPEALE